MSLRIRATINHFWMVLDPETSMLLGQYKDIRYGATEQFVSLLKTRSRKSKEEVEREEVPPLFM